jgi:nucleoside-diphosphate-sugar epimerase
MHPSSKIFIAGHNGLVGSALMGLFLNHIRGNL